MIDAPTMHDEQASLTTSLVLLALFVASLQAVSLSITGHSVTANYVYVFIPLVLGLAGARRRLVRREQVLQIFFVYTVIYLLGIPADIFESTFSAGRRFASFVVFLFPLFLALVEFKASDIRLFKIAVVLASLYYSLNTFTAVAGLSGAVELLNLKGEVGSQRYGFVLTLGFCLALFDDKLFLGKWLLPQRVIVCSLILIGIVFTFSRAAILSVVGGLLFVAALVVFKNYRRVIHDLTTRATIARVNPLYLITPLVLIVAALFVIQGYYGFNILQFYRDRFVTPLLDATLWNALFAGDPGSSEGVRKYLLTRVVDYLAVHPLDGSNYRGLYLLYDELRAGASTHNQYADVFLRTGLVGGLLWSFLLYRIIRFCNHDRGLQAGFVSILIYGAFHETFKMSQGSFIFGMLLSFSYLQASSSRRAAKSASPAPLFHRQFSEEDDSLGRSG